MPGKELCSGAQRIAGRIGVQSSWGVDRMVPVAQHDADNIELDEILADYMLRLDAGEKVSRQELLSTFTQFQTELVEFFGTYDLLQNLSHLSTHGHTHATRAASSGSDSEQGPRSAGSTENTIDLLSSASDEVARIGGSEPHEVPEMIGRYRVVAALGEGTFGRVYRCFDELAHRDVAIKLPRGKKDSGRVSEFLHEAQSAARLRHPNIVTVLDVNQDEHGRLYIVYEYIAGSTLRDCLERRSYSRDEAIGWVADIADALHAAHQSGVVHRDIKPANILIDEQRRARLVDFGLSKRDDRFFANDRNQVLGTYNYMNPEQASRKSDWASAQSDVYSLGVVLYEILCRRLPFRASNNADLLQQIRERSPEPPRAIDDSISKPLEDICLRAMARNPADRFRTARDMAQALRRALEPSSTGRWSPIGKFVGTMGTAAACASCMAFGVQWYLQPQSTVLSDARSHSTADPSATHPDRDSASPNVPTMAPPTAVMTHPRLTISLQRAQEEGYWKLLEADDFPLQVGDKIQATGKLVGDRTGYLYIYHWSESDGKFQRLMPTDEQLADQKRTQELWAPAGAQAGDQAQWIPIKSLDGIDVLFVAASEQRLSADELAAFEKQPRKIENWGMTPDYFDFGSAPEEGNDSAPMRGLGTATVTSPRHTPALTRLRSELEPVFSHYHGWVIRYQ